MKHVPQRSCIACRMQKDKSELVRIVRGADGEIAVDVTGRMPGRGAYVCRNAECMNAVIAKRALNRVYKTQLDKSVYDALADKFKAMTDER